jgi:uncharacterized protein YjbI with pentapeptide repeats
LERASNKGVIDLFGGADVDETDSSEEMTPETPQSLPRNERGTSANGQPITPDWKKILVTVKLKEGNGSLDLLTAGRPSAKHSAKVRNFNVGQFYATRRGGYVVERLRREWKEAYDFVLVDCRSGITDMGRICTIQLPDILAILFTTDQQAFEGAVDVATKVTVGRKNLPFDRFKLLTLPIPSRFDDTNEVVLQKQWMDRFGERVSSFYADWLPKTFRQHDMLKQTTMPYRSSASADETLTVLREVTFKPTSLGHALENLTSLIANKLENAQELQNDRHGYLEKASRGMSTTKKRVEPRARVHEIREQHQIWLDTKGVSGELADFSKGQFASVDLRKAELPKALFVDTNLSSANFVAANVAGANFSRSILQKANLREAKGSHANLNRANLSAADLTGADFSSAILESANLREVKGCGANLQRADLTNANLSGACFAGADFKNANLQGATLINTDLRRANLTSANLTKADLKNARLTDANLESATVTGAKGMTAAQFGGANLSGVDLPTAIVNSRELRNAKLLSRLAQIVFFFQTALCVYAALLLLETTDVLLLTGQSISYAGFGVAPQRLFLTTSVVISILYLSLQFMLRKFWKKDAELPAIYPEGGTLDEKISNWFTETMKDLHRGADKKKDRPWRRFLFGFLAWWLVPVILQLFWLRFLPLRELRVTSFQIVLVMVAVVSGMLSYGRANETFRHLGSLAVWKTRSKIRR